MVEGIWSIKSPNEQVPHIFLLMTGDTAGGYHIAWHGDLATDEFYRTTDVFYDVSDYYDVELDESALMRDMFNIQWIDEAEIEYHDFFPDDMEEFPQSGISGDLIDWWHDTYDD